jgi:hypothetical protein
MDDMPLVTELIEGNFPPSMTSALEDVVVGELGVVQREVLPFREAWTSLLPITFPKEEDVGRWGEEVAVSLWLPGNEFGEEAFLEGLLGTEKSPLEGYKFGEVGEDGIDELGDNAGKYTLLLVLNEGVKKEEDFVMSSPK